MLVISYLIFGDYVSEREEVAVRLKAVDIGAAENINKTVIEEEMGVSFKKRIVTPFFESISKALSALMPTETIIRLDKKLINANGFYGLNSEQFLGFCGILGVVLAVLIGDLMLITKQPINKVIGLSLVSLLLGLIFPFIFLEQKIITRKATLQRELPDVLDLLTVSVEAGLGFDGALVKLSEKMKGQMVDEFNRMLQEIRIGVSRRDALRALAARCNVQDVSLFTGALIQADQLGVSISKVLRIQSTDMREKRRQRAEEQAMKAPIKMLFPLVFFIFPALFIVLLGPAVLQLANMFSNK